VLTVPYGRAVVKPFSTILCQLRGLTHAPISKTQVVASEQHPENIVAVRQHQDTLSFPGSSGRDKMPSTFMAFKCGLITWELYRLLKIKILMTRFKKSSGPRALTDLTIGSTARQVTPVIDVASLSAPLLLPWLTAPANANTTNITGGEDWHYSLLERFEC